ncbi:MAG: phosphatidate cytidylyltransferase [Gammaproteobacteria bacterium]
MLKLRLITAAVLIPIVVGGVLWLSYAQFALFFAVFAVVGGWEWSRFLRMNKPLLRVSYATIVAAVLLLCWNYVIGNPERVLAILITGLVWWICALVLVYSYPKNDRIRSNRVLGMVIGLLVIVPCWIAIIELRNNFEQGPYLVLFLVALIAVADSTAYFGGKKWGRNKLAPQVSPGKTWEGVISGLLGVSIFSFICAFAFEFLNDDWQAIVAFIIICVVTAITSVLGDLSESMFKRQVGLKDSGKILPGHGGVLDRVDSLTAAAPLFAVCLWFFIN